MPEAIVKISPQWDVDFHVLRALPAPYSDAIVLSLFTNLAVYLSILFHFLFRIHYAFGCFVSCINHSGRCAKAILRWSFWLLSQAQGLRNAVVGVVGFALQRLCLWISRAIYILQDIILPRYAYRFTTVLCISCLAGFVLSNHETKAVNRRYKDKKDGAVEPEVDPERDQRTVFAYQISLKADERDVYEFFSRAGKVRDVRLIMDRNSRRSKGVGYIEFYDAMSVPMAIALSGQPLLGQPVMVKPSEAEKNLVQSTTTAGGVAGGTGAYAGGARKLYVGNLHYNMKEDQLRQVFESFGTVELVQLPTDETGNCKGFGFIQFARLEDARAAQSLNGQLEIAGRMMKVSAITDQTGMQEMGVNPGDFDDDDGGGLSLNARSRALLMQKLDRTGTAPSVIGSMGIPTTGGGVPLPAMTGAALAVPPVTVPSAESVGVPSECLLLNNMFDPELEDEPDFDLDIKDDVQSESSKYGKLRHIYVEKNSAGFVYLRFENAQSAVAAQRALHGRWFAGKMITATFMEFEKIPDIKTRNFGLKTFAFHIPDNGNNNRNTAGPEGEQAVALRVQSECVVVYRCRIEGYQDTLLYQNYRQFYRECVITGTVDFIFGEGTTINDSDNQYAISMKEDTAYPCLHLPKTTKETSPIHRIQKRPIRRIQDIVCEYSERYQTWSLLQETPIRRIQPLGYAVSNPLDTPMDDLNITMEEYIKLEEEKARKRGKVFNWETAKYGKIWYDEDIHDLRSVETEFPAIAFNDEVSSEKILSCEPTVKEQNVLYFNDLFPFNIIHPDDLKSEKDNDDSEIDKIQSSEGNEITQGGQDMALPLRDQRYRYLRYEGSQYTDADITDFEARLTRIYKREVHRVQVFDFGGLTDLMAEGLSARMLMEHMDAQGHSVFGEAVTDLDITGALQFQLGGVRKRMSWREFILALGLYTAEEMQTVGFGAYWAESARQIPDKGDLRDYWIGISSVGDFLGTAPSYTAIRDPILRLCHRLIACSIAGRSQAPEKVTVTDLFYLRGMDVDSVNVPYLLARYLRLFAAGRKSWAHISGGQFVARLAGYFRLLTAKILQGLTVIAPALSVIDMAELPDAATGAHGVAQDAPVINEGDQADPAPVHAPPPPPVVSRSMPHRMARLEENIHKIRGTLAEQREVIGAMARDFSRFCTWATTSLARMMDRACVIYTSYSQTLREYQRRRVRQRTG
ncbi:RNA-binding protein 39 isoform X2 [Tanacetum coccineum]